MQPFWVYSQTGWAPAPEDFCAAQPNDIGLETWLASRGYERWLEGEEYDGVSLSVWRATADGLPYAALVEVAWSGSFWELLGVTDLPAVLEFLRRYGQIGVWPTLRQELEDLKTTLARAFEAWHGHPPDTWCRHCDQQEELLRLHRQERRRAQEGR